MLFRELSQTSLISSLNSTSGWAQNPDLSGILVKFLKLFMFCTADTTGELAALIAVPCRLDKMAQSIFGTVCLAGINTCLSGLLLYDVSLNCDPSRPTAGFCPGVSVSLFYGHQCQPTPMEQRAPSMDVLTLGTTILATAQHCPIA